MKFEARTKDSEHHTYGVWNNDMQAFQFIYDWNGTETLSLETAIDKSKELNEK